MWVRLLLISLLATDAYAGTVLDALNQDCQGGAIYLEAGTYPLSHFVLHADCSLIGAGIDETRLDCDTDNPVRCLAVPASAQKVRLSGFTLIGHGEERIRQGRPGYVRGIGVQPGTADVTIEQIRIIDGGQRAIEIYNPQKATVRAVEIWGTSGINGKEGDGIHVDGWATRQASPCKDVAILDNYIERPGDTAISTAYCSHVEIARNRIFGATYFGGSASIEESGLDLTGVVDARVHDNHIWRIARYCAYASSFPDEQGEWRVPQTIWFERNFCSQFVDREEALAGIYVIGKLSLPRQYATDIHFLDNRVIGVRGTAVALMAAVKGFSILRNDFQSQSGAALLIGSSPGRDISDGVIRDNDLHGGSIKIQFDVKNLSQ